jgi:predicted MFS family arabinose efflux permease
MMLTIAGSAFAGPIDWAAEKLGYVPEAQLTAAKAETAKAVSAAKQATDAANAAAGTAKAATSYGIFLTALLGGLAIFRKRIAKQLLEEKPEKDESKEV